MAGQEGGGRMTNFVQSKNAGSQVARQPNAPQPKGSNEDLKIATPKTSSTAANTGQARIGSKPSRVQPDARNARRESIEGKAFYDTDTSNIDDSSVTSSTRKRKADATEDVRRGQSNGHANGTDVNHPADDSDYGSEDEEGDGEAHNFNGSSLLHGPGGPMAASAIQKMRDHDSSGARLPRIKGDSYPPTTSGNPSVAESIEPDTRERQYRTPAHVKTRGGQVRSTEVPFQAPNVQEQRQQPPANAVADQEQSTKRGGLFVRPESGNVQSVEQVANAGFTFGKVANPKVPIRQSTKKHEQPLTERTESRAPLSSNPAQRATAPSAHYDEAPAPRQDAGPKHIGNDHHEAEVHRRSTSKSERTAQAHSRGGRMAIDRTPDQDPASGEEADIENERSTKPIDQRETDEPDQPMLDYDADELLTMDYHEVKAKSFDEDPNGKVIEFPEGQTTTTLDGKIDAVANFQPKDQFVFFESLSIDEWEQAGDWFITRFGQVLDKLKTNRKDTRDAAKAYENEIEERHGAVSKKRKQIEDELKEMKESGGKVLQGTPKKPKTK